MEPSNNSFTKSIMTSGAILGVALVAYSFILSVAGLSENKPLGIITYVILIGGIVFGIKQVRDKIQNGFITYGRTIGTGTLVSLFAGIILGFYIYLHMKYVDPNLMVKAMEETQQKWIEGGMSDDQIEMMSSMMENFMTPGFAAFSTIFGFTLIGTVFSLIIGAFMKKEPDIFATPNNTLDSNI